MAAQDLPLRDIHLPEPIGWWPPAPGWWMLLVLLLALAGSTIILARHIRRKRRSPKRHARRELADIQEAYRSHGDDHRLAQALSAWLRRVSLTYAGRHPAAALTGRQWLAFLDGFVAGEPFSHGPGQILTSAPYGPTRTIDAEALLNLCSDWLESLPDTSSGADGAARGRRRTSAVIA